MASNQMIAVVAGGSAAVGTAGGVATATGAVAATIDGVAYTWAELAALGPEVLAELIAAKKLSQDVVYRLLGAAPLLAQQVRQAAINRALRSNLFTSSILNQNRYLRIGFGKHEGYRVFRIGGAIHKRLVGKDHTDIFRAGRY